MTGFLLFVPGGTGAAAGYFWRHAGRDGDQGWDATLIQSLSVGLLAVASAAGHLATDGWPGWSVARGLIRGMVRRGWSRPNFG